MKLVILDESGSELQPTRVSLINGGVEIVIAGSHVNTATEVRTDAEVKRDATNDEPATTGAVSTKPASVFSDSGAEGPAEKADAGIPEPDADGDTGSLPESDNLPCVDKTGRGWDKRIDSSSEKIVKSTGIWARRKNVPDEIYNAVINELAAADFAADQGGIPDSDAGIPDAAAEDLPVPEPDGLPEPDAEEAPLPENNVVGDDDDDALKGILSTWG